MCFSRLILIICVFYLSSCDFWLINYLFGLISINYLFGFNIKDNGIRYYNFDIVTCFELFILLLLQESHIDIQIWNLMCLSHNMIFVKSLQFILILSVCIYIHNYWEFCLINLRIVNYFVDLVTMHLQLNNVLC